MLNLNKTKRNIALILALVTVLAMCLVGCTDQEARDAAEAAKKAADAAVTQQQLTTAVENALKDLEAGVSEETVAAKIEAALAGYAKTTDIQTALADYAKTSDVEAVAKKLVDTAIANVSSTLTSQATELKDLANSKIDIEAWKNATEKIIAKCIDIDALEKKILGEKEYYTEEDYEKALNLCYAAKIRLYRAVSDDDLDSIVADIEAELNGIATADSEAKKVAALIDAISFPVTTLDADAITAAKKAYDEWCTTYATVQAQATAKGISVGKLEYAVEKKAALEAECKDVNDDIRDYIETAFTALGITFQKKVDEVKDANGKVTTAAVSQAQADAINLAKALSDDVVKKIYASRLTELKDLYTDYVTFVGTKYEPTEVELKEVKTADKDGVKAIDKQYKNNGVSKTADDEYVVYFAPVLEKWLEVAYEDNYNTLKTEAIKSVLNAMQSLATDNEAYKAQITKLGTLFADVMEAELAWKNAFYQADTNNEYAGDNLNDKWNYAIKHLDLVVNANKTATSYVDYDVNGFVYYLQQVAKLKSTIPTKDDNGKDKTSEAIQSELNALLKAYVDEKATEDFAKQVILDCYNEVKAVVDTNDNYETYKLNAINAIAKLTAQYIDGKLTVVPATQRAKDAAKNIVLAYISAIKEMKFSGGAFTYADKATEADAQAKEHFVVLVAEFEEILKDIPTAEADVAEYETDTVKDTAIAKVMSDALTVAKANVAQAATVAGN